MNEEQILRFREQKDAFFKRHSDSPLTTDQRQAFDGLRYFEYNADLVYTLVPEPVEGEETIQIMTTTNEIRNYRRYGRITFHVDDTDASLTIYETPHGYFLPFVDNSDETYGAGRYLDLEPEPDGAFKIDFNLAYNPYCVYNENYSCPLTPLENRLTVPINAGEKVPEIE